MPDSLVLGRLLEEIGGEISPDQLGIDGGLVLRARNEAHHLRDCFTALKFLNEIAKVNHKLGRENQ